MHILDAQGLDLPTVCYVLRHYCLQLQCTIFVAQETSRVYPNPVRGRLDTVQFQLLQSRDVLFLHITTSVLDPIKLSVVVW